MSALTEQLQQDSVGAVVDLYELDCTGIGGVTYYYTNSTHTDGSLIEFNSITYNAIPIVIEGVEQTVDGAPARPSLILSNIHKALHAQVVALGDLVGAKVTRTRTFSNFLDGQTDADPTMTFSPEVYEVEQKTSHNRNVIKWTLRSVLDKEGLRLPRRQILRDQGFPGAGLVKIRT